MSLAEIEAALEELTPDELRRIAVKSWTAFVEKEGHAQGAHECDEDDPSLLAALDEAIAQADSAQSQGHSAAAVRQRLKEWTSK
jgi:hypothetical protein